MNSRAGILGLILESLVGLVLCGVLIWQIFVIENFQPPRADQRTKFRDGAVANGAPVTKIARQIEWVLIFIVISAAPGIVLGMVDLLRQLRKYPKKAPRGCLFTGIIGYIVFEV